MSCTTQHRSVGSKQAATRRGPINIASINHKLEVTWRRVLVCLACYELPQSTDTSRNTVLQINEVRMCLTYETTSL